MDYKFSLQHCDNNPNLHRDTNKSKDVFIVVPYSKGLSKSFKNIRGKVGVQVLFMGNSTVKDLLVPPKDRDSIVNKGGVIYKYKCNHQGCTMDYIGETDRNFGDRYKEHIRAAPHIFDHSQTSGPSIKLDNFSTVDTKTQGITRTINKVMYIGINDPLLNRNFGKYQLPHIWDGCYRTHWLSIYSDPPHTLHSSHGLPSQLRGHIISFWVSMLLPQVPPLPLDLMKHC